MLQHNVDWLGCSGATRAHQQRNHRHNDRENETGKQFSPQWGFKHARNHRHEHTINHIAADAEERARSGGGIAIAHQPLNLMNAPDFLVAYELRKLGIRLNFENKVIQARPGHTSHSAFSRGH